MSPSLLMTDPAAYQVAYAINPWMDPSLWASADPENRRAARRAWAGLRAALEAAGAKILVMPGAEGAPDLVFPANAAVVLNGLAILAQFRAPERQVEEPHFAAAFARLRAKRVIADIATLPPGLVQEGAGDAIWDPVRQLIWAASGPRSSLEAPAEIGRLTGEAVVHMPLATARYYHLDTCFCPLSGGEILYYPPALSREAMAQLVAHTTADQRLEASDADAKAFCVNAVCLGRTIIMARPPARLAARLAERGYQVVGVDLDPFILSGGGAFCMTLRLDHRSAAASARTRPAA